MSTYGAVATGNFSSSSTWGKWINTPTIHASTNITVTASNFYTQAWTAPNTSSVVYGMYFYLNTAVTGGLTVTLQESTVDTAATTTLTLTGLAAAKWYFVKFASPYTYTTTGAGAYRFRLTRSGSNNIVIAADSGGANAFFIALDSSGTTPGTGENFVVVGDGTNALTAKVDGTSASCGAGLVTATSQSTRSVTPGIMLSSMGKLVWDDSTSATLTLKETILVETNGYLQMLPSSYSVVNKLTFDMASTGNHGIIGVTNGCNIDCYSAGSVTGTYVSYVSGTGTAADPLIVSGDIGIVDDELLICAGSNGATNYSETERRFIKTKNSSTSYVLSNTAGGAEAALTYTKIAGTRVVNIQSNIIIETTSTSLYGWTSISYQQLAGKVRFSGVRFSTFGESNAKVGLSVAGGGTADVTLDHTALIGTKRIGIQPQATTGAWSVSYLVSGGVTDTSNFSTGAIYTTATSSLTLNDCTTYGNATAGYYFDTSYSFTLNRCISSGGTGTNTSTAGGFVFVNSADMTLNDCEAHCARTSGIIVQSGQRLVFNDFLNGTMGNHKSRNISTFANTPTISVTSVFNNYIYNSNGTFLYNYTGMLGSSIVAFDTLSGTTNNHIWYTKNGSAQATGAGLSDTTVHTSGSLGLRIAPENSKTGFTWTFKVLAKAGQAVSCFGFSQKNVAFGTDSAVVNLYLPGSITPDDTFTISNNTAAWEVWSVSGLWSGTVDRYATIEIVAKTTTASAYLYIDDIYNGTNKITAFDTWDSGQPSPIMFEQLGDAAAVWSVLTSTLTTSGTIGNFVTKLLSVAKFLGLK